MNIVLIHPYIKVRDLETYLSEPLGLVCLASYAEQIFEEDVKVTILDLYALGARTPKKNGDFYILGIDDEATICQKLKDLSPDLIGLHCNFTAYANEVLELADLIKKNFSKVPIVIGGAHPTEDSAAIMDKTPSIDYLVRGEGEVSFANLIRHLRGEIPVEEVKGLLYRDGNSVKTNVPQPLIGDINELPIPDRKFIDMEAYKFFNKETIWYVRQEPVATLMTSRGCPYYCVFCSTAVVWQRKWRERSLELVFKEIETLYEKYGIREFVINDDQFMLQRKRVMEFCQHFIDKKLDISFCVDAGISLWLTNFELLKKMRQAGFYSLRFPIESGSEKTLKYVKKPVKLDKAKQIITDASRLGFWTSSNIIVGFPYETKEDVKESIGYAYNSTLDFTSFIIAKPHAGSEMYEDFKKSGLLEKTIVESSDFYRSDYDTLHLTAAELNDIVHNATNKWFLHKTLFYLNPVNFYKYFLPKIQSRRDLRYFIKVFSSVYKRKIKPMIRREAEKRLSPIMTHFFLPAGR